MVLRWCAEKKTRGRQGTLIFLLTNQIIDLLAKSAALTAIATTVWRIVGGHSAASPRRGARKAASESCTNCRPFNDQPFHDCFLPSRRCALQPVVTVEEDFIITGSVPCHVDGWKRVVLAQRSPMAVIFLRELVGALTEDDTPN
jgi:hypothetical protein